MNICKIEYCPSCRYSLIFREYIDRWLLWSDVDECESDLKIVKFIRRLYKWFSEYTSGSKNEQLVQRLCKWFKECTNRSEIVLVVQRMHKQISECTNASKNAHTDQWMRKWLKKHKQIRDCASYGYYERHSSFI